MPMISKLDLNSSFQLVCLRPLAPSEFSESIGTDWKEACQRNSIPSWHGQSDLLEW